MSKYLTFPDVVFRDRRLLLAALADLGYDRVEEGEALPLYGYRGDRRPETAALVVRRRHVGRLSNDIGFTRTPDGYVPVLSEYDREALHGGRFLPALRVAYGERTVAAIQLRLRGSAHRAVEGNVIKIRVRF